MAVKVNYTSYFIIGIEAARADLRRSVAMPPKPPEPVLISAAEAGRRLRLDPRRVRAAIKLEQIPSVEIGNRKLVPVTAIERLIETK